MLIGVALLWKKEDDLKITPDKLGAEGVKLLRMYEIDDDDSGLYYIIVFTIDISNYPQSLVDYIEFLDEFWKVNVHYPVREVEIE